MVSSNRYGKLNWPPQSPDLNTIENLWSMAKKKLDQKNCASKKELYLSFSQTWSDIAPIVLENLLESMPKRIEQVIANKGGARKY